MTTEDPWKQRTSFHYRIRRTLEHQVIVANIVGPALLTVYFNLTIPAFDRVTQANVWVTFLYFAGGEALLIWVARLIARRDITLLNWMAEEREPTLEEQDALLRAPWSIARFLLPFWVGTSLVVGTSQVVLGGWSSYALRIFLGINLAGLSTLALCYLLVERSLRPVLAIAFRGRSFTKPTAMSVRRRMIVAWALGSGVPIFAIAVIPLGRNGPQLFPIWMPLVFMSLVALIAGFAVTFNLARALAEPIDDVRTALARVEAGDLDVDVGVNDAGEIGLLQAGVNQMVSGLRERRHLHDLFGRHVGEEVARHALERGAGLGAEQREVSVFFIDLVSSTPMAESHSPNEVVELLNAVFAAVVQSVKGEGGWVNKFEGDAALCVFGAPVEQPDHADRALRAALALRNRLDELTNRYRDLKVGIGVSSGLVVAGNVGAEERYEYTVIGAPVNEASRLTDEAKQRSAAILASASVVGRAHDAGSAWSAAGSVHLRGFATDTEVYEPLAT